MNKLSLFVFPLLLLVGCREIPKSNIAIKYYDSNKKEVQMITKYQKGPTPRLFYENTCVDGDAVQLTKNHRDTIENLYKMGSNCVEINLLENGIK